MRILFILLAAVSINALAADATPSTTQDQATQVPQCYNGDDSKFYKVGEKATISGVPLICDPARIDSCCRPSWHLLLYFQSQSNPRPSPASSWVTPSRMW